jgi:hypothetical protein
MSIIKIVAIVGLLVAVGYFFKFLYDNYTEDKRTVPTEENNKAIAAAQIAKYDPLYLRRDLRGPEADAPLINYNVLGCRIGGYVGPVFSGIFDEDNAIRIALRAGCRAFCLNISTVEGTASPVLIVRTMNGDRISNNVGSVYKVCQALVRHAPRDEPIILFLYFERIPNPNAYDVATIKFMMDVAIGLKPLRNRHLGLTNEGDYRRQKMQDMLFLRNRSQFDGKFIILTNMDTTGFRPGVLPTTKDLPAITTDNDLDLWSHGRVFTYTTTSLGATAGPGDSKTSGPRVETIDYFKSIPADRLPETVASGKVNWTMAMNTAEGRAVSIMPK